MSDSLATLKPDTARRVGLWERDVVTATETTGWLLDRFAFALLDFPNDQPAVAETLDSVPITLISKMAERLAHCRSEEGRWRWPAAGTGLADPVCLPVWGFADPAQANALDVLADWLRSRAGAC